MGVGRHRPRSRGDRRSDPASRAGRRGIRRRDSDLLPRLRRTRRCGRPPQHSALPAARPGPPAGRRLPAAVGCDSRRRLPRRGAAPAHRDRGAGRQPQRPAEQHRGRGARCRTGGSAPAAGPPASSGRMETAPMGRGGLDGDAGAGGLAPDSVAGRRHPHEYRGRRPPGLGDVRRDGARGEERRGDAAGVWRARGQRAGSARASRGACRARGGLRHRTGRAGAPLDIRPRCGRHLAAFPGTASALGRLRRPGALGAPPAESADGGLGRRLTGHCRPFGDPARRRAGPSHLARVHP
jgi:hypothetical protein